MALARRQPTFDHQLVHNICCCCAAATAAAAAADDKNVKVFLISFSLSVHFSVFLYDYRVRADGDKAGLRAAVMVV